MTETNASNVQLLKNKTSPPAFLHRAHNTTRRPDLTFISTDIINSSKITVLEDIGSDHRYILLNIGTPVRYQPCKTTKWNYNKANWAAFAQETHKTIKHNGERCQHNLHNYSL